MGLSSCKFQWFAPKHVCECNRVHNCRPRSFQGQLRSLPIRSPGILVSSKVSFMGIFAGVRWRGASNESGVLKNGDFRFFALAVSSEPSHKAAFIILCYVAP